MAAVYENRENDDIALCLFGQTGICFRVVNYCTILYMPFVLFVCVCVVSVCVFSVFCLCVWAGRLCIASKEE